MNKELSHELGYAIGMHLEFEKVDQEGKLEELILRKGFDWYMQQAVYIAQAYQQDPALFNELTQQVKEGII